MSRPLLAYHNDPAIKRKYLARVRRHIKADELVQGYGYWHDGKGCAVGCTVERDNYGKTSAHARYRIELGIPENLALLEDNLFESLPKLAAREWPVQFLSVIKTGADLSDVYDQWLAWHLADPKHGIVTCVPFGQVRTFILTVAEALCTGDISVERRSQLAEEAADLSKDKSRREGMALDLTKASVLGVASVLWFGNMHAASGEDKRAIKRSQLRYYKRAAAKLLELLKDAR